MFHQSKRCQGAPSGYAWSASQWRAENRLKCATDLVWTPWKHTGAAGRLNIGYPGGAAAYFSYIDAWRKSGSFEGLTFR